MLSHKGFYTPENVQRMWNNIAFNNSRKYAFNCQGQRWFHPDRYFESSDDLYNFISANSISDVHVKALDDNLGREWVIDVDFKVKTKEELDLKIKIATRTFKKFYGENLSRIMFSGNRGIHVWLRIDRFPMSSTKEHRERYFKIFEKPNVIQMNKIVDGSFIACYKSAIESISELEPNIETLHEYWPEVDKHIFCTYAQIRAPYSYNYKGFCFSKRLA
ncbi:LEF-1 [Chrysodeixis includens nucleopolyhedrovirus]|uniref:LEF-1 n=1 Tax=Chrysodeixis includens nucleopolyhedrovirus TaxID=1207438 RepID=A0A5B8YT59_9ABAC|nr:LEF-1 [Chrysodeixis includens nucleopolyhedrovirus]QED40642.1 LEF-1 [Chrysodeixis includens nucleopolyhedrovirus]